MIVDAILGFFQTIVDGIVALIPVIDPPDLSGFVDSLDALWAGAGYVNKYLPLDQAGVVLGILALSWVLLYTVRVVVWLASKAHVLGGGSS